jgi:hypothetical protein
MPRHYFTSPDPDMVLEEGPDWMALVGEVCFDLYHDWPAGGVHLWYSHDGVTWNYQMELREPPLDRRRGPRGSHGVRPERHERPDPKPRGQAEPTTAPPGSPEKVDVLAERARRRQPLFHPDDAPDCAAGLTRRRAGGRPHRCNLPGTRMPT